MTKFRNGLLNYLTLFGSMSTLICCALPALFVSVGLGAVVVGLTSSFPNLIWISENKNIIFSIAGSMLFLNGLLLWKSRNAPCPIEPKLREVCIKGRKTSQIFYILSLIIFLLGFSFAYIPAYAAEPGAPQIVQMQVTEQGFEPRLVTVNDSAPVVLKITRKTENTCATDIKIKNGKIHKKLPLNESVTIDLGKLKKGKIGFACGMDMITGEITIK